MTAESQLYPFSTEDGKPIPLDIVLPLGIQKVELTTSDYTAATLGLGSASPVFVFSKVDCIIDFAGTLSTIPSTYSDNAMFVPANTVATIILPEATTGVRIFPQEPVLSGAFVVFQKVQKWAGLGLKRQLVRR